MDNREENINSVSMIVKKVIGQINIGKSNIFKIVDNIRDIEEVIKKVDKLQVLDKNMRATLVQVSKNNGEKAERIMEKAYEEALKIRVEYITKQNEEKDLKRRRNS